MPTPGAVRAMALDREISVAINSLPEAQRDDARKIMHYASAIGNTIPSVLVVMMVIILPVALIANYASLVLAVAAGLGIMLVVCFCAFRTRRRLVAKMNTLIKSNPNYWRPIQTTLEAAVSRVDGAKIIRK